MDSHDLPRSLVPARQPALRPSTGLMNRPAPVVPEVAPTPQFLRITARGARRYWWLILGLWVLGTAGLATGVYLRVRPLYHSESYLRVEVSQKTLFEGGSPEDTGQMLETLVNLIKSPNVMQAAAVDPKAAELPRIRESQDVVQELRKSIGVQTIPGTYLISVSMSSIDPHEPAILVNAVVDAFMKANREWSDGMTSGQINNLEAYLEELKAQAAVLEKGWKSYAAKGEVDVVGLQLAYDKSERDRAGEPGNDGPSRSKSSGRGTITVEQSKQVHSRLFEVNLDLAKAEAWRDEVLNSKKTQRGPATDEAEIYQEIKRRFHSDADVAALGEQLTAAKDRLGQIEHLTRERSDPALTRQREVVMRLQAKYDRLWEVKSALFRAAIRTNGADPEAELRDAEFKCRSLRVEKESLEKKMNDLRVANSRQATDEVEIALIREEWNTIKAMQNAVHRKLDDLKFATKDGARVRLIDKATAAGRPSADNRLKYYAMTPVGVLAAALALAVLLELKSGRVSDPDLLSSRIRHEVFAIAPLPAIRAGEDARNGRAEQKLARFVQSLDHLRVALCDGGIAGEGRCVLITSASGGEGKTTLSAHLAARCANAGTSILLIDADLRRASLGRLLDVPSGPGLADVLDDEARLEEALVTVQAGGFHFLSAGTPGRDPSRVLSSPRLSALIDQLRATYDLVLIDSPPILPVPDALLLGRHADGVVMASRFDASRLPLVERASRQLAAANIPVLGVVVNGARPQAAEYGQYHYAYQYPNRNEGGRPDPEASSA